MGQAAKPAVVLVNPQLGENIGTAARAMGNFALDELRLVEPRDGWPNKRAGEAAAGADWIVEGAEVYNDLAQALADCRFVYATTARPRGMIKQVVTPADAAADMHARAARGEKTAILFGRERWGLNNDEISLADVIVMAPVNPQFASLNIAQAVLLVGYEWFKLTASSFGQATPELPAINEPGLTMPDTRPATKAELGGLFEHLETELDASGFFKSRANRPTMVRSLRNLLHRAELTEQEIRTLRGVIASLVRQHLRPKPNRQG